MEVEVKKQKAALHSHNGMMSSEEIHSITGNGWAIVKNPVHERGILVRGELLFHSDNYQEAIEAWGTSREKYVSIKYCGKRDPNVVYIL